MKRRLQRLTALAVVALVSLWWGSAPAFGHVLLSKAQPNPDGTTTLTFTFDHGCGEAPTNGLAITTPAGVAARSASGPPGWQVAAEPSRVVFTGPPVPAGTQAEFLVTVTITGARVAQSLAFPATQTCPGGETLAWQDLQADAEHPAPSLVVTAAMLPAPAVVKPATQGAPLPYAVLALSVLVVVAAAAGFVGATGSARADEG
jgi:periplasmic copper chaperone A